MGLPIECISMLNLIKDPAFFADAEKIIYVNKAAESLGITTDTALDTIICQADTENQLQTTEIRDKYYTISSSTVGAYKLYTLEKTFREEQLQSLLRAAQNLRMPLSALNAKMVTLLENAKEHNDTDKIDEMQNLAKHLFTLHRTVSNMSDIKKLISNKNTETEFINAFSFIKELCDKLQAHFAGSDLNITYSIPASQAYCNLNASLVRRAFYNMISNSIKARSHNIHIELSKKGTMLELTVTDDGYGIHPDDKAQILSRFKEEPTLDPCNQGLGLGMLIIHAAATAHNGTVMITDNQPSGCKITVTMTISNSAAVLKQTPFTLRVDPLGGIDPLIIELSELLSTDQF